MAASPNTKRERPAAPRALDMLVTALFHRCGMSEADAALLSDSLVTADLEGVHSHGDIRVPESVHKLTGGWQPFGSALRWYSPHGGGLRRWRPSDGSVS